MTRHNPDVRNLVIGIDDGAVAAVAFADETNRAIIVVDDTDGMRNCILNSVPNTCLISGGSTLTSEDIERVTSTAVSVSCPIGFIGGWGGTDMANSHVQKMLHYPWSAPPESLLWSSTGYSRLRSARSGQLEIVAPNDPALWDRLAVHRRLIGLSSHGNGIDGPLGPGVLCSMLEPKRGLPGRTFFPCGSGGPCVRGLDVGGKIEAPRRISPTAIAGDVIIWYSCWGVLTAEAIFDPGRSLAQDFLNSQWAGALLTTYKSAIIDIDESVQLLALSMLNSGTTLGEICLELNRISALGSGKDHPWVLLGDPVVRFRANEPLPVVTLPSDVPAPLLMRTGVTYTFDLDSADQYVLMVRAADGQRIDSGQLYVGRVKGAAKAAATYMGLEAVECTVTAHSMARPPALYHLLRSILDSASQLAFTQRFLSHVKVHPKASRLGVPPTLEAEVATRLAADLAVAALAPDLPSVLSGLESSLASRVAEDIEAWVTLNDHLLDYLLDYCQRVGALLYYTYSAECRLVDRKVADIRCPYCQMPLDVIRLDVPLTGMTRRNVWCYRCALICDTSIESVWLWLRGPDTVEAGSTVSYTLEMEQLPNEMWRYYQAALTIDYVPMILDIQHMKAEFSLDATEREHSEALTIRLPASMPAGVYFLTGAVAAHGDLWTCRRPIVVHEPGKSDSVELR